MIRLNPARRFLCALVISGLFGCLARGAASAPPSKGSDLFGATNLWTVHLTFTPEQWKAMEPAPPQNRFGPPPGVRFGPSMFLAPAFIAQGDQNQDGKLSRQEWEQLGSKWFAAWDRKSEGRISLDQLRDGLNATLMPNPGAGPAPMPSPATMLQGPEGRRNGLASMMGINFEYVHADLDFHGQVIKDVAVRYKGNGTWMQSQGTDKRSMKIDLNRFVKGQKIAGQTTLNLHSNVTDASWMNEVLSHKLFRDAGVPAPRTAYARVYVTVPGQFDRKYLGVYSIVEDIGKNFMDRKFDNKKGAIFKPVTNAPFTFLGDNWSKYKQTYDPKEDVTDQQTRRIIDFCRLVSKGTDEEFASRLGEFINLDEFSRFMAVTVWLSTLDSILSIGQNYYVYLDPTTAQMQFIPWDLDHSFGQFMMKGTQQDRENLSIEHPWEGQNLFLERVFKVDEFKKLYLARLREFSDTLFKPERFVQQVDQVAAVIRPAVADESPEKLARFDKVVAGEPVEPAGFGPVRPMAGPPGAPPGAGPGPGPAGGGPRMPMLQPPKPIKGFVVARAQSVIDQLAGKSRGIVLGALPAGPVRAENREPFGPGVFMAPALMARLDANKDSILARDEFSASFARWFDAWDKDKTGTLTEQQLRDLIDQDMLPSRPPQGPGPFGPPGQVRTAR